MVNFRLIFRQILRPKNLTHFQVLRTVKMCQSLANHCTNINTECFTAIFTGFFFTTQLLVFSSCFQNDLAHHCCYHCTQVTLENFRASKIWTTVRTQPECLIARFIWSKQEISDFLLFWPCSLALSDDDRIYES